LLSFSEEYRIDSVVERTISFLGSIPRVLILRGKVGGGVIWVVDTDAFRDIGNVEDEADNAEVDNGTSSTSDIKD